MSLNRTLIEWVKNPDGTQGYSFNPITGCLNGCEYCYARKIANGRVKNLYLANNNLAPLISEGVTPYHTARMLDAIDPFYPRFWPERIFEPWDIHGKKKPKGIFTCDMSDLFGIGIPDRWTGDVLDTIRFSKTHRFYLLTKQPQNLAKWSPFPDNCYVGVTVCNPEMMAHAINGLALVEATVKYISFEPLLERIIGHTEPIHPNHLEGINWLIIGAQTKPNVYPKIEWVKEIVEAADKAGIPVFQKDNLRPLLGDNLRQELPG